MDTQEAMMRKTSPNDTNHIVWAIKTCFILFYFFFTNLSTGIICVMELWMDLQEVTMRRTGQNDGVSCCLGHS